METCAKTKTPYLRGVADFKEVGYSCIMAELTLTYRGDKTEIILLVRNTTCEPWRDVMTLSPGEAMELSERLRSLASAIHEVQIQVKLAGKVMETKTGREL